jgi:hypothetical protein
MRSPAKLAWIRFAHTAIYLILAGSVIFIVVAGITRHRGPWLTVTLVLTAIEAVVFVGNGFRCPLTDVARRYGAEKGWAFDTFLPERWTRYTFRVFGGLLVIGLAALLLRPA